jgi:hypothetical protein
MRARSLPVVLLVLAGLIAPAGAGAASTFVFGSDLAPGVEANLPQGCDTKPTLSQVDLGAYFAAVSNVPDCTWTFSGVPNPSPARPQPDTRGNTVPGDGTIVKAEVRTGANPAPLRFVILQQVESVCCYFVRETEPVPLQPNATNVVPLNLAVERNTIGGVAVYDKVAVSADATPGLTLPIHSTGLNRTTNLTTPENPDSEYFYRRMGQVAGDGRPGGGRMVGSGLPGTELLVRWTWNSVPDPIVPPPVQNTPVGPPQGPVVVTRPPRVTNTTGSIAPALLNPVLRVANNQALVQLLCQGDAACTGQLNVVNLPFTAPRAATAKKKAKTTIYATAKYTIKAGARGKIKVKLNPKGKALLKARRKQRKTLKLLLQIRPKGGKITSKPVTFK